MSGSYLQSSKASDSDCTHLGSPKDRTITATVESLKGGCLVGDYVPVKITVNHTKHVKSMQGAILTLYRHARVDTHPAIPIGPMSEKERKRHDDYYPKSLTGLGGLSLSGAGSSHIFRKDLTQVVMPLIVDHRSLTAEFTAKLRVPEDAFPTLGGVPGAMISFKYYIEVILDIQGKLAGQERYFAQSGSTGSSNGRNQALVDSDGLATGDRQGQHFYDHTIIDTAPIRRDKSVVTCVLEVVIGTRDSERIKGKGKAKLEEQDRQDTQSALPTHASASSGASRNTVIEQGQQEGAEDVRIMEASRPPRPYSEHGFDGTFVPPPPADALEGLSEKERLRRAEASLFPSQPPGVDDDFAYRAQATAPTIHGPYTYTETAEPYWEGYGSAEGAEWSTPLYEPMDSAYIGESSRTAVNEDKQDLHRQQLQTQTSEPPGAEEEAGHDTEASQTTFYPAYPAEDDLYADYDDDSTGPGADTGHDQAAAGVIEHQGHLPQYSA